MSSKWQQECMTEMLNEASEAKAEKNRTAEESFGHRVKALESKARQGDKNALNDLYTMKRNGFYAEDKYAAIRKEYDAY